MERMIARRAGADLFQTSLTNAQRHETRYGRYKTRTPFADPGSAPQNRARSRLLSRCSEPPDRGGPGAACAGVYGVWRPIIVRAVPRFVDCGDLKKGSARMRCLKCCHESFVAFPCRGLYVCPSCHQKQGLEKAVWVAQEVSAQVAGTPPVHVGHTCPPGTSKLAVRGNIREVHPDLLWLISSVSQRSCLLHSISKVYPGGTIRNQIFIRNNENKTRSTPKTRNEKKVIPRFPRDIYPCDTATPAII